MSERRPQQGLLVCVSGPSGVGKGTVIQRLRALEPRILHSVSVTTRPIRAGEKDGVSYHFLSRAQFEQQISNGEILEYDEYCGNYYGTPLRPLQEAIAAGVDVVMDVTVPGSLAVLEQMPAAVSVFLLPPTFAELRRRLTGRGTESAAEVRRRLEKARSELSKAPLFNYVVTNDDAEVAAKAICAIIQAERCRYQRHVGIEQTLIQTQ